VIVPLKSDKASTLKPFLKWAISTGQTPDITQPLQFFPLPKLVRTADAKFISKIHS
jgi:ABC-type phosphate transport system substrate-binding protein